jgi:hypothetical protein
MGLLDCSALIPLHEPDHRSKYMQRNRPISLNDLPDTELEASNLAQMVINAYSTTMAVTRNEQKAFDSAVRAWRERNPNASPEEGPPAVATIICHNL